MEITVEKESRNEGNVAERSWIGRRQVLYERDSRCSARATTERAPVVTTNPFHWRCSCVPVSKVPPLATTGSRGACAVSPRPLSSLLSCHCTARTVTRASHTLSTRSSYFSSRFSYLARFLSSWTGDGGLDLICRVSCVVLRMELRELWMRRVVSTRWVEIIALRINMFRVEGWIVNR